LDTNFDATIVKTYTSMLHGHIHIEMDMTRGHMPNSQKYIRHVSDMLVRYVSDTTRFHVRTVCATYLQLSLSGYLRRMILVEYMIFEMILIIVKIERYLKPHLSLVQFSIGSIPSKSTLHSLSFHYQMVSSRNYIVSRSTCDT